MRHDDGCVCGPQIEVTGSDSGKIRDRQDMNFVGFAEVFARSQLGTAIANSDEPAQSARQANHRPCVIASAKDPQAGPGRTVVNPDARVGAVYRDSSF